MPTPDGPREHPSVATVAFAVVSIIVLSDAADAPLQRLLGAPDAAAFAIPIKRLLLVPTFVGSALILAGRGRATLSCLRDLWPIVTLVAWAVLSTLWSSAPAVSLTWSIGLAGTTAFGVVLALRFSAERELRIIALALALLIAGSLLTVILPPELRGRLGVRGGNWVGLYLDRNLFGRVAGLCGLACMLLAVVSPPTRWAALGGGAALWLLHGSHSVTAQIAALASLTVAGLLFAAQRVSRAARRRLVIGAGTAGVVLAIVLVASPRAFLAAVGRDVSLTGRVAIWRTVAEGIRERPLLGHGYGAFWSTAPALPHVPNLGRHAHNGFLDLSAELGVLGGLLFVIPAAWYARRAVRHALAAASPVALWPPAYLTFLLVTNIAESALVRHKLYWALYVAAVARAGCDASNSPSSR
jgi:O-antigen ligase